MNNSSHLKMSSSLMRIRQWTSGVVEVGARVGAETEELP
jgi:hypothetical protein